MSYSNLVPFAVLTKISRSTHKDIVIGGSNSNIFVRNPVSFYGLNKVTINNKGSYVEAVASITLSQDLVIEADDDSSLLNRLLMFSEKFKLEYGWAGDGGESKYFKGTLSDLMLAGRPSLTYASDTRTFGLELQLISTNSLLLDDIKVGAIKTLAENAMNVSTTNTDYDPTDYYVRGEGDNMKVSSGIPGAQYCNSDGVWLHPQSLANTIKILLEASKTLVRNIKSGVLKDGINPDQMTSRTEQKFARIKVVNGLNGQSNVIESEEAQPTTNEIALSSRMLFVDETDIPSSDDIRLICFDIVLQDGSTTNGTELARDFSQGAMQNTETLNKLWNVEEYANTSVLQMIDSMLSENGFTIWQTPDVVNKEGKMKWTILQSSFNNIGEYTSYEFPSILNTMQETQVASSFKSIFNKNASFDIHSNNNVIISIDAGIDSGEFTIYNAISADKMAGKDGTEMSMSTPALINNIKSMYQFIAQEAKEIGMVILGTPSVSLFDDIDLNLGGMLWSGKYKVIEFTHEIDENVFTTAMKLIQTKTFVDGSRAATSDQNVTNDVPDELVVPSFNWREMVFPSSEHKTNVNDAIGTGGFG